MTEREFRASAGTHITRSVDALLVGTTSPPVGRWHARLCIVCDRFTRWGGLVAQFTDHDGGTLDGWVCHRRGCIGDAGVLAGRASATLGPVFWRSGH